MQSTLEIPTLNALLWAVRILSAMPGLFLSLEGGANVVEPEFIAYSTLQLGHSEDGILRMGFVLFVRTLLYVMPESSGLDRLLSNDVGDLIAPDECVGNAPLAYLLLPVYFGVLTCGGLLIRDKRPPWLVPPPT